MIVITGAAGFIGSCMVSKLNQDGRTDLILVDDFSNLEKNKNIGHKQFEGKIHRNVFFNWLKKNHENVDFIFHLGARTDTAEFDRSIFDKLNLNYSKKMWELCSTYQIPLIYASSAATYGLGELGYDDKHEIVEQLKPLNAYGESKNDFDKWMLKQENQPPCFYGLKFFNVYGPNEYHKGRMASVILHSYRQIKETKGVNLFRSHRPDYKSGMQLRDFVYVKDLCKVMNFLMNHKKDSGIYNLGTGQARAFLHLAQATFDAMSVDRKIEFIDTPVDIRDKYQYFTEANMDKLRSIGYDQDFYSLEDGVKEYVQGYLMDNRYF
jgi:ADP-L-glycero-D-manno-heptose 6-epimerase